MRKIMSHQKVPKAVCPYRAQKRNSWAAYPYTSHIVKASKAWPQMTPPLIGCHPNIHCKPSCPLVPANHGVWRHNDCAPANEGQGITHDQWSLLSYVPYTCLALSKVILGGALHTLISIYGLKVGFMAEYEGRTGLEVLEMISGCLYSLWPWVGMLAQILLDCFVSYLEQCPGPFLVQWNMLFTVYLRFE